MFDLISAGDNFFKPASYTIEALCAKTYEDTTHNLQDIEAQILRKRNELRQFETEYRKVCLSAHRQCLSFISCISCILIPLFSM